MLSRLRERGQRITPQRLAILRILADSEGHPSVEKIYDVVVRDFPTTSLATVYKTVTLLKELGEVLELEFSQGSNRYDGSKPFPHPHVVCTRCRRIVDPDLESLSALTAQVSRQTGFKVVNHRLDFYGLCPQCQKEKR
ncbi:MAG: transcriptional repressor [bacterium]|nr:MAG: transcriptional repressor [bacterium]